MTFRFRLAACAAALLALAPAALAEGSFNDGQKKEIGEIEPHGAERVAGGVADRELEGVLAAVGRGRERTCLRVAFLQVSNIRQPAAKPNHGRPSRQRYYRLHLRHGINSRAHVQNCSITQQ